MKNNFFFLNYNLNNYLLLYIKEILNFTRIVKIFLVRIFYKSYYLREINKIKNIIIFNKKIMKLNINKR
jgi:hypothetical protein